MQSAIWMNDFFSQVVRPEMAKAFQDVKGLAKYYVSSPRSKMACHNYTGSSYTPVCCPDMNFAQGT